MGLDELRLKSPEKHVLLSFAFKNTENDFALIFKTLSTVSDIVHCKCSGCKSSG